MDRAERKAMRDAAQSAPEQLAGAERERVILAVARMAHDYLHDCETGLKPVLPRHALQGFIDELEAGGLAVYLKAEEDD